MCGNPVFFAVIVPTDLGRSVVMNRIRVQVFVVWCSVKVWEGVFSGQLRFSHDMRVWGRHSQNTDLTLQIGHCPMQALLKVSVAAAFSQYKLLGGRAL